MKIVHICHNYIDGQTYQDNELPEAHARIGHEVTVISTLDFAGSVRFPVGRGPADRIYRLGACKLVRLPLLYPADYRLAVYKGLYQALEEEKPDLIYFHGMPYFCYAAIVRYKKRHVCKLVVDFHCDEYNSSHGFLSEWLLHKGLYRSIIGLTRRYVDQYYGVTPGTLDFVQKMYGLSSERVKLLPLGGNLRTIEAAWQDTAACRDTAAPSDRVGSRDTACAGENPVKAGLPENPLPTKETMRKALGLPLHAKLIVTAGKIDEGKKTAELAEACTRLRSLDFRLLVIGPVEETYRQKIAEAAGNDSRIQMLGWKSPAEIYRYFLAADLACFPGSQSVIWQQAVCCGLPLACRYWPGGEYLDCGGNVCFLPRATADALQVLVGALLADKEKLEAMAAVSRHAGRQRFSYDRIAQSILDDLY